MSNDNETPKSLYQQACQDVDGLGPVGRIFMAGLILVVLFKMTPILDLLWYFVQIVLLPLMLLVAIGVISSDSYNLTISWINKSVQWARDKSRELQEQQAQAQEQEEN